MLRKVCEEKLKKFKRLLFLLFILFSVSACTNSDILEGSTNNQPDLNTVQYGNAYSDKEEVADYLHQFEELPPNFLTKSEARALGWDNAKGNLWEVAEGMSIGGDYFGNREGLLPEERDRDYFEADINYQGGYRNSERMIFSNDGLIFYTEDHYQSFENLYGEE